MPTIEHTAIAATDTRALAEWYVSVLDFQIVFDSEGDPPVFFIKDDKDAMIEIVPLGPDGIAAGGVSNHLALLVEDFDAAKADLEARGVVFDPESGVPFFGGTRIAFFSDPDGHRIQILSRGRDILG